MTYDKEFFEELRDTEVERVRTRNGEYLEVNGKGTVVITSYEGTKFIPNVLFVPKIEQNSVGQLLDKGYKVLFENKQCVIRDASGTYLFNVKMKEKRFALNSMPLYPELVPLRFGTKDLSTFIIEVCFRCSQRSW